MIAPSNNLSHPKKRAFLKAYRKTGNVSSSAKAAKVRRETHYRWLKSDEQYAAKFTQAHEQAIDLLEKEATYRATKGLRKYKFHQGLPIMVPCKESHPEAVAVESEGETRYVRHYYEYERSDTLLIFLLKGARPEKFRDNVKVEKEVDFRGEMKVVEDEDWYGNRQRLNTEAP